MANKSKKEELEKAQKLAAKGVSAKQIAKKVDKVDNKAINRIIVNKAPTSSAGESTSVATPTPTATSTANSNASQISNTNSLTKNLRIAQTGGITRGEFADIAKASKKDDARLIQRMDAMNKRGQDLRLNSGAANMLIKKSSKKPSVAGFGLGLNPYGTGNIGRALAGMIGDPGYTAPRNPQSGGSYGGSRAATPGTGMMIGGTQIRKGGRVAVKGFGKGKGKGKGGDNFAPELDPVDTFNDPVQPMDTPMEPLPAEEPQAASGPGMMSGGGDGLGGATKLNRAKSRLRQLGIYGRGTGLLGRGLQYGNALNA